MKLAAIIVCAGEGKRLGKRVDKATIPIQGKPLFYHTASIFQQFPGIREIVLVLRKRNFALAKRLLRSYTGNKRFFLVEGGKHRSDSVFFGLCAVSPDITHVLVHDGARPLVTTALIKRIIEGLKDFNAVICGVKSKDTVKLAHRNIVAKTLDREGIFLIQTPQGFRKELILDAYRRLKIKKMFDDAQAIEFLGKKVKIVEGDIFNIKITYPQDIVLAKAIMQAGKKIA